MCYTDQSWSGGVEQYYPGNESRNPQSDAAIGGKPQTLPRAAAIGAPKCGLRALEYYTVHDEKGHERQLYPQHRGDEERRYVRRNHRDSGDEQHSERNQHRPMNRVQLSEVPLTFSRLLVEDPQCHAIGGEREPATDEHADQMESCNCYREKCRVAVKGLPRFEELFYGLQDCILLSVISALPHT